MRYSDNIQYLVPSSMYLGTNAGWWARSAGNMAFELSLDEGRLLAVFEGFPAVFRKSRIVDQQTGQHFFALQARYAQRVGGNLDEAERAIDVPPLATDHLKLVVDFVLRMAEDERVARRTWIANGIAIAAAVVAACAAIAAAGLRLAAT